MWFGGGPEVDAEIISRFGADCEALVQGEYDDWQQGEPAQAVAGIIIGDQFCRNRFRGTAQVRGWCVDGATCMSSPQLLVGELGTPPPAESISQSVSIDSTRISRHHAPLCVVPFRCTRRIQRCSVGPRPWW